MAAQQHDPAKMLEIRRETPVVGLSERRKRA